MTSFARHGINHLSVSSVGLFAAEPALFVAERLLKRRGPVGASAHRGTASEAGIVMGLMNPTASLDDCQAHALTEFDRLTALSGDPRRAKEREAVPGIVLSGINELRMYGIPTAIQARVEKMLPGVPLPWVGFLDLFWEQSGIVLDIKSTLKLPTIASAAHARQVSLYTYDTNHEARVGYFTPSKRGVYRVDDRAKHIADLVNVAQRLERFLGLSDDPTFLASIVCPNVDAFWYSGPATRAICQEIFGL
jgi:hypothetical protein